MARGGAAISTAVRRRRSMRRSADIWRPSRARAFSSEVDAGSRKENASNKKVEPGSDSIRTDKALAVRPRRRGSRSFEPSLDRSLERRLQLNRIVAGLVEPAGEARHQAGLAGEARFRNK